MYDSNYYYRLMCSYAKSKRNFQEKKFSYENYISKLEDLNLNLNSVEELLKSAETNFVSGGYVDKGIPLDRGILNKNYINLENNISSLNVLINKTEEKIKEFVQEINKYTNLYNQAQTNYENAKNNEKM